MEAVDRAETPEAKAAAEKAYQKQAELLNKRGQAYKDFCKDNNLKQRNERITIAKWDREQAKAARVAAKKKERNNEKSTTFLVGSPKINMEYINSDEYKRKFQKITDDAALNQTIYKYSKAAVIHQSGSFREDLTIVSLDGKYIETTSSQTPYETMYTPELKRKIADSPPYSLVAIHNHGTNVPPSGADLVSAGEKRYAFGIVACHDGSVYYYSCKKARPFLPDLMDKTVDKYRRSPYNKDEISAYKCALDQMAKDYGIEWREIK